MPACLPLFKTFYGMLFSCFVVARFPFSRPFVMNSFSIAFILRYNKLTVTVFPPEKWKSRSRLLYRDNVLSHAAYSAQRFSAKQIFLYNSVIILFVWHLSLRLFVLSTSKKFVEKGEIWHRDDESKGKAAEKHYSEKCSRKNVLIGH